MSLSLIEALGQVELESMIYSGPSPESAYREHLANHFAGS